MAHGATLSEPISYCRVGGNRSRETAEGAAFGPRQTATWRARPALTARVVGGLNERVAARAGYAHRSMRKRKSMVTPGFALSLFKLGERAGPLSLNRSMTSRCTAAPSSTKRRE
jgi:hypothetical protein